MQPSAAPVELARLLEHGAFVRVLARDLLDRHAAEDAAQEAALRALRTGASPKRPFGWLRAVARHAAVSAWRGDERRRRRDARFAAEDTRVPVPSPDEILEREETRRRVVAHVLALPEPYRAAVLLRYFEELDVAAIAQRTEAPPATVRTRIHRAHALLRERLAADDARSDRADRRSWMQLLAPLAAGPAEGVRAASGGIATVAAAAALVIAGAFAGGLAWSSRPENGGADARTASPVASAPSSTDRARGTSRLAEAEPVTPARLVASETDLAAVAISGRVTGPEGEPLPATTVRQGDVEVTSTGDDGSFLFRPDGLGPHRITFERDGFVPAERDAVVAGDDLDVTLARGVVVAGRVVDSESGRPVAGAKVSLRHPLAGLELDRTTDEAGDFRVVAQDCTWSHLPVTSNAHVEWKLAPFDPRAAPGDWTIRMPPLPRAALAVHIVAAESGEALEDARIDAAEARPLGAGRFAVDAPIRGTLARFEASAPGRIPVRVSVKLGAADVEVPLARPPEVRGRVLDEDGAPVAGADVAAELIAWFAPARGQNPVERVGAVRSLCTAADGSFAFAAVPRSSWRVTVQADGFVPDQRTVHTADSNASGAKEAKDAKDRKDGKAAGSPQQGDAPGLMLLPGKADAQAAAADVGDVAIVLASARTFAGRVVDSVDRAPIAGANVTAGGRVARTDGSGRFAIDGSAASVDVRVAAEGFAPFVRRAFAIDDVAEFALDRGHALAGTVLRADGSPVAGARVNAWSDGEDEDLRRVTFTAFADGAGRFAFEGLAAGAYKVATGPQFVLGSGSRSPDPVRAETGSDAVVVRWPEPSGIAGRVVSAATGAPVRNFRVAVAWRTGWPTEDRSGLADDVTEAEGRFFVPLAPSTRSCATRAARRGRACGSICGVKAIRRGSSRSPRSADWTDACGSSDSDAAPGRSRLRSVAWAIASRARSRSRPRGCSSTHRRPSRSRSP